MWPKIRLVLRDVSFLALGVGGILHQEISGQTSVPLLVVYTTLLGVPATLNGAWLLRKSGTDSSPSSSQQPSAQEQEPSK